MQYSKININEVLKNISKVMLVSLLINCGEDPEIAKQKKIKTEQEKKRKERKKREKKKKEQKKEIKENLEFIENNQETLKEIEKPKTKEEYAKLTSSDLKAIKQKIEKRIKNKGILIDELETKKPKSLNNLLGGSLVKQSTIKELQTIVNKKKDKEAITAYLKKLDNMQLNNIILRMQKRKDIIQEIENNKYNLNYYNKITNSKDGSPNFSKQSTTDLENIKKQLSRLNTEYENKYKILVDKKTIIQDLEIYNEDYLRNIHTESISVKNKNIKTSDENINLLKSIDEQLTKYSKNNGQEFNKKTLTERILPNTDLNDKDLIKILNTIKSENEKTLATESELYTEIMAKNKDMKIENDTLNKIGQLDKQISNLKPLLNINQININKQSVELLNKQIILQTIKKLERKYKNEQDLINTVKQTKKNLDTINDLNAQYNIGKFQGETPEYVTALLKNSMTGTENISKFANFQLKDIFTKQVVENIFKDVDIQKINNNKDKDKNEIKNAKENLKQLILDKFTKKNNRNKTNILGIAKTPYSLLTITNDNKNILNTLTSDFLNNFSPNYNTLPIFFEILLDIIEDLYEMNKSKINEDKSVFFTNLINGTKTKGEADNFYNQFILPEVENIDAFKKLQKNVNTRLDRISKEEKNN